MFTGTCALRPARRKEGAEDPEVLAQRRRPRPRAGGGDEKRPPKVAGAAAGANAQNTFPWINHNTIGTVWWARPGP